MAIAAIGLFGCGQQSEEGGAVSSAGETAGAVGSAGGSSETAAEPAKVDNVWTRAGRQAEEAAASSGSGSGEAK